MKRSEFETFLKDRLRADGFTKVKASVSLFGHHAKIRAKGPSGTNRSLKAELIQRRGKEVVKIDSVDEAWIDELELLDAMLDD